MKKLIQGVHEMLIDCVGTPLNIDVFYREADEETIKLPYLVYNSQSDMPTKYREEFIFTVSIWGVDEHYGLLDEATERIMECVTGRTLIDCCKPLVINTAFLSRLDIPNEDQRLRCKEVRFRVSYYRRQGYDTGRIH
ncbi:hypothetical protein PDL16_10090 [Bacillus cereus group sp. BY9-3LC]|uniref:hypothetical protein n=1 Tax=Bacillus cereus group sp. BY9-3LC TaxID=3018075 RepID=UPI0022DFB502|nr:hypothetical protein [Bacillus cereus group sp. BY9-3LC]MDA1777454.1 hypothetical protein [Bacillus cereus group sp. BY9-3LC]